MTEYVSVKEVRERLEKIQRFTLLRPGAERYAGLKASATGSWKLILRDLDPVAIAWTDWKEGFGILPIVEGDIRDTLDNYLISAKALDIPAGWAYTGLDTFVETFDEDDAVTVSPQEHGKLSRLTGSSSGLTKDEAESEPKR